MILPHTHNFLFCFVFLCFFFFFVIAHLFGSVTLLAGFSTCTGRQGSVAVGIETGHLSAIRKGIPARPNSPRWWLPDFRPGGAQRDRVPLRQLTLQTAMGIYTGTGTVSRRARDDARPIKAQPSTRHAQSQVSVWAWLNSQAWMHHSMCLFTQLGMGTVNRQLYPVARRASGTSAASGNR